MKIRDWNVQCKLTAVLSWNRIGEFWIRGFVVKLWRDLLTLMAVASSPESSKEQIPHNRLLINMTVQSVQQIRRRPEWNPENESAKATQPTSAYHAPEEVGHVIELLIESTFLMTSVRIVLLVGKLWSADSAGWIGLKWPCIAWLAQRRACNNVTNLLWSRTACTEGAA